MATDDWHGFNQTLADLVPLAIQAWANKYKDKNQNYGNSWLLSGETLHMWFPKGLVLDNERKQIMHGLVVRMLDKLLRAANLELTATQDLVGEKASETFFDLGVYAFMAGVACFMDDPAKFEEVLRTQATLAVVEKVGV